MITKKEIMEYAHKITKLMRKEERGNYSATLSSSLRIIYQEIKKGRNPWNVWNDMLEINRIKELEKRGILEMSYFQYKSEYSFYPTVNGSYNKKEKTIQVIVSKVEHSGNGLCKRCNTYCFGDCMS